ncbi:MAG: NAD(P)H-dependent glycerol-3-phosphate dehydrogenase, partial [Lactiplantibacillus argentoratensis]
AQQQNIEMPITEAIYDVLYKSADIKEVIPQLMQREGKPEIQ